MIVPSDLDGSMISNVPAGSIISRAELRERLADRALAIVDVMPAASFRSGHIAGSVNLPLAEIQTKARRLLSDLTQEIAVYCGGPT